ncbi:MAG: hypothetical protein ACYTFT_03045 [Planctomycetota bacterium]|jgi:hypothetical protein
MPAHRSALFVLGALTLTLALTSDADAQNRRGRNRTDKAPAVGQKAPDFKLVQLGEDGKPTKKKVRLSSFKGEKRVALIFGSYT